MCVIHQIVLVWRASLVLGIVESTSRRVRIRREIVDVEALVDAHHATVAITCVVE